MRNKKYTTGAYVSSYIIDPFSMLMKNQQNIAAASYEAQIDPLVMGLKTAAANADIIVGGIDEMGTSTKDTGGFRTGGKVTKSSYGPLTNSLIQNLLNRKEFKDYSVSDFDNMLLDYEYMETKGENINQKNKKKGPGQGYFQIENDKEDNDSFQTAKNRYKNYIKKYNLTNNGNSINLKSFDVDDIKTLTRDQQAVITLANSYYKARGSNIYLNPKTSKDSWLKYHTVKNQSEKGVRWDNEKDQRKQFREHLGLAEGIPREYIQRARDSRKDYDVRKNADDTVSSHLMSYGESNGKYVAHPTLFPTSTNTNKPSGMEELSYDKSYEKAKERNELYTFSNEDAAMRFAKGAWKQPDNDVERDVLDSYQTGGTTQNIPIEVEGGELVQQEGAKPKKIQGPKHESGGVDINVGKDTKVYSAKYGINGETFVARKLRRENKEKQAVKDLNNDPFNTLLANTLNRTRVTNKTEDEFDMMFQQELHEKQQGGKQEKMRTGGYPKWSYWDKNKLNVETFGSIFTNPTIVSNPFEALSYDKPTGYSMDEKQKFMETSQNDNTVGYPNMLDTVDVFAQVPAYKRNVSKQYELPLSDIQKRGQGEVAMSIDNNTVGSIFTDPTIVSNPFEALSYDKPIEAKMDEKQKFIEEMKRGFGAMETSQNDKEGGNRFSKLLNTNLTLDAKLGNTVGALANVYGILAPFANTEANRAATPPNVNHYKGFGEDALKANQDAMDYSKSVLDNLYREIDEQTATAKKASRNSARSINTSRVLDSLVDTKAMRSREQSTFRFLQQIAQLYNKKSELENIQDKMTMSGETAKDLANRQDTDNYYSNRASNIANAANLGQGLGANINQVSYDKEMLRLFRDFNDNPDMETLLKILSSNDN
jgi:hypothetical protein